MPRSPRLVLPGFPHHVTHRGNRRAALFLDPSDRLFYLRNLNKYAGKYQVRIYAYCLMTNHLHLIALPDNRHSLSLCFHDLDGLYADYFNRKYQLSGHLFQERFFASVLDEIHLWNAVRYVEQNPVRAQMVEQAENYLWSSAPAHCGLRPDLILDPDFPPPGLIPDWSQWLSALLPSDHLRRIRSATSRGVPYASTAFVRELESLFKIPLLPRKRGRPAKHPQ